MLMLRPSHFSDRSEPVERYQLITDDVTNRSRDIRMDPQLFVGLGALALI